MTVVLDMETHLRLVTAALKRIDYRRAYDTATHWDPDLPDVGDVVGVTRWAVEAARAGWLLGCIYTALVEPWWAAIGTDPQEAFR